MKTLSDISSQNILKTDLKKIIYVFLQTAPKGYRTAGGLSRDSGLPVSKVEELVESPVFEKSSIKIGGEPFYRLDQGLVSGVGEQGF